MAERAKLLGKSYVTLDSNIGKDGDKSLRSQGSSAYSANEAPDHIGHAVREYRPAKDGCPLEVARGLPDGTEVGGSRRPAGCHDLDPSIVSAQGSKIQDAPAKASCNQHPKCPKGSQTEIAKTSDKQQQESAANNHQSDGSGGESAANNHRLNGSGGEESAANNHQSC